MKILKLDGDKARPYVTPLAWAIFQAYTTLLISNVMKIKQGKYGVGTSLLDDGTIARVLKATLPEHSESIEKLGVGVFPSLLSALEEKFLHELALMRDGVESSQSGIDQAKKILAAISLTSSTSTVTV